MNIRVGDMVVLYRGSQNNGIGFRLWDDPYPFSDDEPKLIDHFWSDDVGLVLRVEDVPHRVNVRAGGKYVKLLNPRGKMGWVIGDNLKLVGDETR